MPTLGAVLTINCAGAIVEITNHGTLEAKGGELDIVREAVTNTALCRRSTAAP